MCGLGSLDGWLLGGEIVNGVAVVAEQDAEEFHRLHLRPLVHP